jgi:hypothetical protein
MQIKAKTQGELVAQDQGVKPEEERFKVNIPGLKDLHTNPTADIAEVLTTVLKSQSNIVELKYRVGEYIELAVKTL